MSETPPPLPTRSPRATTVAGAVCAGAVTVWIDQILHGDGWRAPVAALVVGGAFYAAAHALVERVGARWRARREAAREPVSIRPKSRRGAR